jgi:hypothetical protein
MAVVLALWAREEKVVDSRNVQGNAVIQGRRQGGQVGSGFRHSRRVLVEC